MVNEYKELLKYWVEQNTGHIALIGQANGVFHRIKEQNSGNQEIFDLCTIFLYENQRRIQELGDEIGRYNRETKKSG